MSLNEHHEQVVCSEIPKACEEKKPNVGIQIQLTSVVSL